MLAGPGEAGSPGRFQAYSLERVDERPKGFLSMTRCAGLTLEIVWGHKLCESAGGSVSPLAVFESLHNIGEACDGDRPGAPAEEALSAVNCVAVQCIDLQLSPTAWRSSLVARALRSRERVICIYLVDLVSPGIHARRACS